MEGRTEEKQTQNEPKDVEAENGAWEKVYSKTKKRYYWFNRQTRRSQWTQPSSWSVTEARDELDDSNSTGESSCKRQRKDDAESMTAQKDTAKISRSGNFPKVAIIVPYRDLHVEQKRASHLARFVPEMIKFLSQAKNPFHIYIIEQSNDNRKFNRGKLLNIGFDQAEKDGCDIFIFHDVDLLPSTELLGDYTTDPNTTGPIHIARVWDRYSKNAEYFGGIVSFSSKQYHQINGFPNNYWGWGGEDDEMKRRVNAIGIKTTFPKHGTIEDMENMTLPEKLTYLKGHRDWKCMMKWELGAEHATTWKNNGLSNLDYTVLNKTIIHEGKCSVLTVDVQLNNHELTDSKCLLVAEK